MTDDQGESFDAYLARGYTDRGMSIRALVGDTGRAYGTVRRRLLAAGVELRSKGGHDRSETPSKITETGSDQA